MDEAVASPDSLEQNTLSRLFQKTDVVPGECPASPEDPPEEIVLQVCCSTEFQPAEQPAGQHRDQPKDQPKDQPAEHPEADQPADQSEGQPAEEPAEQPDANRIPSRTLYPLVGSDTQLFDEPQA